MRVKSLHIYPVKSLRGIDLNAAEVRPRGLAGDRRFMLVRRNGQFITQRTHPRLARIKAELTSSGIRIYIPEAGCFDVPYPQGEKRMQVTVWRDQLKAAFVDHAVNAAISAFLGAQVALVHMDAGAVRAADKTWAGDGHEVSFADGFPVLITNHASLGALNAHIVNEGLCPLSMDRFRPNIVVDCETPWAENDWQALRIGEVELKLVKPCARCVVTSIDQKTGKPGAKSALSALKTLNPSKDPDNPGVIFGQNAVVTKPGHIAVGTPVEHIG